MTARLFAQVDEASGGRCLAGVGAGWTRAEFEMMGIPFPGVSERLRMMDEAVAIMRGLWSEESFSFEGEHYQVRYVRPAGYVAGEDTNQPDAPQD